MVREWAVHNAGIESTRRCFDSLDRAGKIRDVDKSEGESSGCYQISDHAKTRPPTQQCVTALRQIPLTSM